MELNGAGVLVTGGASGLGAETVRLLSARGAICTIFDLDEERARALSAELGGTPRVTSGDVTDEADVTTAVSVASDGVPLRLAVSCAGINRPERTLGREGTPHDLARFSSVIAVNLIGTFNVLRLAAVAIAESPPLVDGERGLIVNTASVAAFEGQIGQIAYSASKGGVAGMTLPAARDLAAVGIRVVAIAPGLIDTPMLGTIPEAYREQIIGSVAFPKRLGLPSDFAGLVAAVCDSPYLNGVVIRLDGGLRLPPR